MAGVQEGLLYKPQENSKGKLRLLVYNEKHYNQQYPDPLSAKRPLEIVPLLAEPDELKNDKDWRNRLEFRPSEFKKRARYAILLDSAWQDVANDIYISDVVRFSCVGDKGNDDAPGHSWLADVQSFTLQKKKKEKELKFRLVPDGTTWCDAPHRTNERIIPLYGSIDTRLQGLLGINPEYLRDRVEFRPSEHHKNRYFAVVLDSPWKDMEGV
tara:strand:+ start:695 stop:1330 length:636 start_codon:yes stop_codon:yes gene_type:complete